MKRTSYEAPHYAVFSSLPLLIMSQYLPSTLFLNTFNVYLSLGASDHVSHP